MDAKLQALERAVKELSGEPRRSGIAPYRKPISEFKVIQDVTPFLDDKGKFHEWNRKFVNAMGQVDPAYEPALKNIMEWADADVNPDLEHGWPGAERWPGDTKRRN